MEYRKMTRATVLTLVMTLVVGLSSTAAGAAASVERVEGPFLTVVPTAFADNPAGVELMFAECDFVQRVEKPDGTAVETQHCHLTEPFFEFPGTAPDSAFTNTEGECVWFSDYWSQTTGAVVYAESVRLTVTPSGKVSVTTKYPAELLDC